MAQPPEDVTKEEQENPYIDNVQHRYSVSPSDEKILASGFTLVGIIGYFEKQDNPKGRNLRQDLITSLQTTTVKVVKGRSSFAPPFTFFSNSLESVRIPKRGDIELNSFLRLTPSNEMDFLLTTYKKHEELARFGYSETELETKVFAFREDSENRVPLYIYTNSPEVVLSSVLSQDTQSYKEKTNLKQDVPSDEDSLGRAEYVKRVVSKISSIWNQPDYNSPYTIHLNGIWGSGKSSILLLLDRELQSEGFKIVHYNAWENERFSNPWWILINKISEVDENHKRWNLSIRYSDFLKIGIVSIIILVAIALILYFIGQTAEEPVEKIGFYVSVLSFIGVLWALGTKVVNSITNPKEQNEILQKLKAADPFGPVKKRFKTVTEKHNVAVFIDDMDRCRPEAAVHLLEGIQTLYKDGKILYVVAGDGKWIARCFDEYYSAFAGNKLFGNSLGNHFLEKTFQLRVDVPKVEQALFEEFITSVIDPNTKKPKQTAEEVKAIEEDFASAKSTESITQTMKKYNNSPTAIREASRTYERIEESESKHILQDYLSFFPKNPRTVIRLINQYTIKRQSLIIQGVGSDTVSVEALIKWTIFEASYPIIAQRLRDGEITKEYALEQCTKNEGEKSVELIDEIPEEIIEQHL